MRNMDAGADYAGSNGGRRESGRPFRVIRGSETSPVRVEFLDDAGRVTHVRPGSGLELLLYQELLNGKVTAQKKEETHPDD